MAKKQRTVQPAPVQPAPTGDMEKKRMLIIGGIVVASIAVIVALAMFSNLFVGQAILSVDTTKIAPGHAGIFLQDNSFLEPGQSEKFIIYANLKEELKNPDALNYADTISFSLTFSNLEYKNFDVPNYLKVLNLDKSIPNRIETVAIIAESNDLLKNHMDSSGVVELATLEFTVKEGATGQGSLDFNTLQIYGNGNELISIDNVHDAVFKIQQAVVVADADNDGVVDDLDNCPNVVNVDQYDANSNGVGGKCDSTEHICVNYQTTLNGVDITLVSSANDKYVWNIDGAVYQMGAFEETLDAGGVLIQSGGIAGDYCAFTIQVSSTAPDYECVQDTDCAQGSKCVDSDLNVVGVQGVCVDAPLTCEENCEAVKIICYADEYMTTTACNNDYSACVDACVAVETPPAGGDIAVGPGGIGPGDIILPEGQQVGTDTIVPALNVPTYDCTGFDEFTGPQGDLIKISKPTVQCKQGLETCENGVCVAVVTPEPVVDVLKGDVNNDGSISIIDALKTKQYFLGQITEFTDSSGIYINGVSAADVNCDGSVTIIDALKIKQKFLGQIESFTDSTGGVCQ